MQILAALTVMAISGAPAAEIPDSDIHIHVVFADCRQSPDHVFGKSAGVYYACIGQREVCSAGPHPAGIPLEWIEDYDRRPPSRQSVARKRTVEQALRAALRGGRTENPPRAGPSPPAPIPATLAERIEPGATVAEVVALLGRPYMRIVGDSERLTYRLDNGARISLEFEGGKLAQQSVTEPR